MTLIRKLIHSRLVPDVVIRRRCRGLYLYFSLRDNLYYILMRDCFAKERLPEIKNSLVWDIGSNVGIYTMWLASRGNQVVAVDCSKKALALLSRAARKNGYGASVSYLSLVIPICAAFATTKYGVTLPHSAWQENKPVVGGQEPTLTWKELRDFFGTPVYIKMDIEGGEYAFLDDREFMEWINANNIQLDMELHGRKDG